MSDNTPTKHFHSLYYHSGLETWQNTRWMGLQTLKCPLDLWIYQEIVFETQPHVIIETGTHRGGSAHYLASLCEIIGCGRVITVDLYHHAALPKHPRITYLTGSSTSRETGVAIEALIHEGERVMVILDSDHSRDHVTEELKIFSRLVTEGCYLIVEDTNVNGHPVLPQFGPGPMEAVSEFLKKDQRYLVDATKEKFLLTFNPKGYLKRVEGVPSLVEG